MHFLKQLVALVVLFVLAINLLVYVFQEKLIFQARTVNDDLKYTFEGSYQELFLDQKDSARIHALHFQVSNPKGVVLYFHGNRSDLSRWGKVAGDLTQYGYDVVMMDYRGYGKSYGPQSEEALYQDAFSLKNYIDTNYNYKKLVYYGRSLGSGVAVDLASQSMPDLLILETPFSRLTDAIDSFGFLFKAVLNRYKLNSLSKAESITCPTLVFHGTKDIVIPLAYGHQLFNEISSKNKSFIKIDKGGHNNLNNFAAYHESLKKALGN